MNHPGHGQPPTIGSKRGDRRIVNLDGATGDAGSTGVATLATRKSKLLFSMPWKERRVRRGEASRVAAGQWKARQDRPQGSARRFKATHYPLLGAAERTQHLSPFEIALEGKRASLVGELDDDVNGPGQVSTMCERTIRVVLGTAAATSDVRPV